MRAPEAYEVGSLTIGAQPPLELRKGILRVRYDDADRYEWEASGDVDVGPVAVHPREEEAVVLVSPGGRTFRGRAFIDSAAGFREGTSTRLYMTGTGELEGI